MKKKIMTAAAAAFVSIASLAQDVTLNSALEATERVLSQNATSIINVISLIIGIVGVAMLAWQGAKYLKGDGNSNDALMKVGSGLLIIAVLLEIIKAVFLR